VLAAAAVAEQRFDTVEERLLSLADLHRMDLEGPRQLGEGTERPGGLQGDLALKAAASRFLRVLAMMNLGTQPRTSVSLTSRVVQETGSTLRWTY